MDKDPSVIPFGDYCYRVEDLRPGEVLSADTEEFGRGLREMRFHHETKRILFRLGAPG